MTEVNASAEAVISRLGLQPHRPFHLMGSRWHPGVGRSKVSVPESEVPESDRPK